MSAARIAGNDGFSFSTPICLVKKNNGPEDVSSILRLHACFYTLHYQCFVRVGVVIVLCWCFAASLQTSSRQVSGVCFVMRESFEGYTTILEGVYLRDFL